jgi:hypothetical protein
LHEGLWFLFDNLAVYLIKMSFYVFVFEMRHIYEYLTSETSELYEKKRKRRKFLIYLAFIGHTSAIIIINIFSFIVLTEEGSELKNGVFYQVLKVFVMVIDLCVIASLWATMRGFQQLRINSRLKLAERDSSFVNSSSIKRSTGETLIVIII